MYVDAHSTRLPSRTPGSMQRQVLLVVVTRRSFGAGFPHSGYSELSRKGWFHILGTGVLLH